MVGTRIVCPIYTVNLGGGLKYLLSGALAALLFGGAVPFMQFERRHHGEHPCEVI